MTPRRRRPENTGLPKRWRFTHGAYYYQVPPGLEHLWDDKRQFRLGKTLPEAYRVWAERLEHAPDVTTIRGLLERYAIEVIPHKAPKTQTDNTVQLQRLIRVFGHMPISAIRPQDFYQYHDKREAKTASRRELALLSHALTKAVEWGAIARHPTRGQVRLPGEVPRTRYVEDWEIVEILSVKPVLKRGGVRMVHAYIRLKLLTGLRRGDLLRVRIQDLQPDGLHVLPHKTKASGKRRVYEWTPALEAAVELAIAARPVDIGPYLFCDKRGACYVKDNGRADGWDSMWQRFMSRVLTETKVTERFTEHDLRAKTGSDAESLERAQQLLAHADSAITRRVYRRKPERIRPAE